VTQRRRADAVDWIWVAKCRLLGGAPTLGMFDAAVEAGDASVPLLVDVLSRRELREGELPDCSLLPVHAMRILAAIGSASCIPALVNVLTDPVDPALYGEEAALALARIGVPALPALERVLRDSDRDTWIRLGAGRGLMFAALADRRLRGRVCAAYERVFLDQRETDRRMVAHLAADACLLAAAGLLPAIEVAFMAGRVEPDVVDVDSVRIELLSRHQRPDAEAKELVRRDVREDYLSWEEIVGDLQPEDRLRIEGQVARIERLGAEPPAAGDDASVYGDEFAVRDDRDGRDEDDD